DLVSVDVGLVSARAARRREQERGAVRREGRLVVVAGAVGDVHRFLDRELAAGAREPREEDLGVGDRSRRLQPGRADGDEQRESHGKLGGGTRRLVAASNAYASSIRRGSLQAIPVKLTPNGAGWALNTSGMGGLTVFGTSANGTITVG